MQPLSRKEVTKIKREFCRENKIPQEYRRKHNTLVVDFRQLERYSLDFYEKTNQKDLAKLKKKAFVMPQALEKLYYEELINYINNGLSERGKQVFKMLIYDGYKQKTIAKQLRISQRMVRKYVRKIKNIAKRVKK